MGCGAFVTFHPSFGSVVSHEREPGELGYVARYRKLVKELDLTPQL